MSRIRGSAVPVVLFALLAFLAMGYHPGAEDDIIYLSAVKAQVNPALYPYDGGFFKFQMRASIFDNCMASLVHATGISVAWAEFLGQALSILVIFWAAWGIVSRLFPATRERWGGVALLGAMFTLPVAGTALYLVDQYLHPRNIATALILVAVERILAGRRWQAAPILILAFALHPMMGAYGISFCVILTLTFSEKLRGKIDRRRSSGGARPAGVTAAPALALIPFGWVFYPQSQAYMEALRTRQHLMNLYNWDWYEWLGAIGPLVLFWLISRLARRQGNLPLSRFATAVLIYGVFQQAVAMILLQPLAPAAAMTLEPMRFLQLIYLFLTLIGGACAARYLLKAAAWRWAIFLLAAYGSMFFAQRQLFASTPHMELPGRSSANPWLQAFGWIRANTPADAYFALDPQYISRPGVDYHAFRPLAERSVLADPVKDSATVTKQPELAQAWQAQSEALKGWETFQLADFERLKSRFGVSWVLVGYPQPAGLACPWHNAELAVCRVP